MEANRELASWLLCNRHEIERVMHAQLGAAAPDASGPEAETLRRFRTFALTALTRGVVPRPVLDGLRPNERRVMALLRSWTDAAMKVGGGDGRAVDNTLSELLDHFRTAIRGTAQGRKSKGRPRAARRAVAAAIDRVADAFLAVDCENGQIVDANPAAGAMLGVARDALLGVELSAFAPTSDHDSWWTQFDAVAEGEDARVHRGLLADAEGRPICIDATITRFATRDRTLALVLARPALPARSPIRESAAATFARPSF